MRCEVDSDKLDDLLRLLVAAGVRTLVSQPPTLEELFLRHYSADADTAGVAACGPAEPGRGVSAAPARSAIRPARASAAALGRPASPGQAS